MEIKKFILIFILGVMGWGERAWSQYTFDTGYHACGSGSPIAAFFSGDFSRILNARLGCCLNYNSATPNAKYFNSVVDIGPLASPAEKFDCTDNSDPSLYASFDALWSLASDGHSNAILLRNSLGQRVTGFFKLNGQRCDYDDVWTGNLSTGRVTAAIQQGQTIGVGGDGTFEPTGAIGGMTDAPSGTYTQPSTAAEKRMCPILVRSAMTVQCPTNGADLTKQATYTDLGGIKYCATAGTIKIYTKIQQVYSIAGSKDIKTSDTFANPYLAPSIDVTQYLNR